MMCCLIAGLVMAALGAGRALAKGCATRLPSMRWAFAALAAGLVLAGGAALGAGRLDHARAGQGGLAAFLMRHICGGQAGSAAH